MAITMDTLPIVIARLKEYETGPKLKLGQPALKTYRCPTGKRTIGWGHTGPDVVDGMAITREEAEALFAKDLAFFERGVERAIKGGAATTIGQFSAMVSFAYNTGLDEVKRPKARGLGNSTLLKYHRAGRYAEAAEEFGKWTNGGMRGLVLRREFEKSVYLS